MAMNVNIGDVVAWADVPDGALVRDSEGWHALCRGRGIYVGKPGDGWLSANAWPDEGRWRWQSASGDATIVALGLTGQESADDLRRLAEVFEVREALGTMRAADHATERALEDAIKGAAAGPTMSDLFAAMTTVAERLHAAGWRPGMTAEDAARLLAGET